MFLPTILLLFLHIICVFGLLRGTTHQCEKEKYTEIAQTLKSPNTMYYVVTIISLKTSTSPHIVADCLGFYWHKNLQQNKYKIQVSTLH
jgi:hypothetical protein